MVDNAFKLDEAPEDVQNWVRNHEWPAIQKEMKAGEVYTNSIGNRYYVIEDSPAGKEDVKVSQHLFSGTAIRYVHKAVVLA